MVHDAGHEDLARSRSAALGLATARVVGLTGGLAVWMLAGGCASPKSGPPELLPNGTFDARTSPWQSVNTINVPGVYSRWNPSAGREHTGAVEINVDNTAEKPSTESGEALPAWVCGLPLTPQGRSIALMGWVRGIDVSGTPGILVRAWSGGRARVIASVDTMASAAPRGDFLWTPLRVVLDVPANATEIDVCVYLRGRGTVWFDDLSARLVGESPKQQAESAVDDAGLESD